MTPSRLDEWLEVLRSHHVTDFSCPAFSVTMAPSAPVMKVEDPELSEVIRRRQTATASPKGLYSHHSLWSSGKPPEFPGNQRDPVSPHKEIP